jgi:hypothetical protein
LGIIFIQIFSMAGSKHDKKLTAASNFIKYASVGFQMLAVIGVFTFVGHKIDGKRNTPLFTAIFGLIGVIIALYQVIRSLTKNKS